MTKFTCSRPEGGAKMDMEPFAHTVSDAAVVARVLLSAGGDGGVVTPHSR